MKYVFHVSKQRGYDWYECTQATPFGHICTFTIVSLRHWFLKWVFK